MANTVTIRTKIDDQAKKGFGGLAMGLTQLMGGAIIPVTAAAAALAVELAGAGAAAGVFGAAVIPQITAIKNVSTEQDAYNKAVKEYGKSSTQAVAAQKKLNADMKGMAPATRDTAHAFFDLKSKFSAWSDGLASSTMPVFTHALRGMANIFPLLTPLVKSTANEFGKLTTKFEAFTKTSRFKQLVSEFSTFASGALRNVVKGIGDIGKALGHGFESKGFHDFLQMGKDQGPGIVKMFKDLATFVGKFVKAAGPMGGLQLKALEVLANALNAIPMGVLEVLAPVLLASATGLKLFRMALMGFEVINGLVLGIKMLTVGLGEFDVAADANPIGVIVLALAALAAGFVYAYKHSETFRLIVQDAFDGIKWAAAKAAQYILVGLKAMVDGFMNMAGAFVHGAALAFGWIPGIGGKLKSADRAFDQTKGHVDDFFNHAIDKAKGWSKSADNAMRERKLKMNISDWDEKIAKSKRELKTVPASKKAKLLADIRDLEAKKRKAQNEINSLHGKTVTMYMRVVKSGSMAGFTNIGGIARRAGGAAESGGMRGNQVLVGEGGPEVVNLPTGSYVHSNSDSRKMMSGGGSSSGTVAVVPIYLFEGGPKLTDLLIDPLRKSVQKRGGITAALGKL